MNVRDRQAVRYAVRVGQLIEQRLRLQAAEAVIDAQDNTWVVDELPQELPYPWTIVQRSPDAPGAYYARSLGGLHVIATGHTEQDGRRWLHVSYSRRDKLPDYRDSQMVKDTFIGPDRYAYAVYAAQKDHVNIAERCLHLWCCVDAPEGRVLPDFTWNTGLV